MTIPTPFTGGFPFNQNPFRSRVESQIDAGKNYYAVAFKPGYPLQASELNEMQEISYVQRTLSNILPSQGGFTAGTVPWNGCTPLGITLVSCTLATSPVKSLSATANPGWYLIQHDQTNGGFGAWVYNGTARTLISGYTGATANSGDYGIKVKFVTICCTTNPTAGTTQDRTLQDSHNMNIINGPCGADRLKIDIVGAGNTIGSGEYLVPLITAARTGVSGAILFKNNLFIKGIT